MAIKRITPEKQIMQYMDDVISDYEAKVIHRLMYAGEACVKQARELTPDNGSFHDQTGNLRSSIGYMIVRDGQFVVRSAFDRVPSKKNTGGMVYDGDKQGVSLAEEIAGQFSRGIVLIVVAGMKYAAHVEARGKDVLTSSEMKAEKMIPKLLTKLNLQEK